MQILFDELDKDTVPDYEVGKRRFTIDMSFSSNDPDKLTALVKKKLEKIRTNIVAWRTSENGDISVGVGHYYDEDQVDYGDPLYPHWWSE